MKNTQILYLHDYTDVHSRTQIGPSKINDNITPSWSLFPEQTTIVKEDNWSLVFSS